MAADLSFQGFPGRNVADESPCIHQAATALIEQHRGTDFYVEADAFLRQEHRFQGPSALRLQLKKIVLNGFPAFLRHDLPQLFLRNLRLGISQLFNGRRIDVDESTILVQLENHLRGVLDEVAIALLQPAGLGHLMLELLKGAA